MSVITLFRVILYILIGIYYYYIIYNYYYILLYSNIIIINSKATYT